MLYIGISSHSYVGNSYRVIFIYKPSFTDFLVRLPRLVFKRRCFFFLETFFNLKAKL